MSINVIKSLAKQSGKSESEVEDLYYKAKEIASKSGNDENYAYIIGIFKKMLGINETFREYLNGL